MKERHTHCVSIMIYERVYAMYVTSKVITFINAVSVKEKNGKVSVGVATPLGWFNSYDVKGEEGIAMLKAAQESKKPFELRVSTRREDNAIFLNMPKAAQ